MAAGSNGKALDRLGSLHRQLRCLRAHLSPVSGLVAGARRLPRRRASRRTPRSPWTRRTGPGSRLKPSGVELGQRSGRGARRQSAGQPLGGSRRIEVACFDGRTWKAPAAFSPQDALAVGSKSDYRSAAVTSIRTAISGWLQAPITAGLAIQVSGGVASGRVSFGKPISRASTATAGSIPFRFPNSWARNSTRMGLASANGSVCGLSGRRRAATRLSPAGRWRIRVIAGSLPLPRKARSRT